MRSRGRLLGSPLVFLWWTTVEQAAFLDFVGSATTTATTFRRGDHQSQILSNHNKDDRGGKGGDISSSSDGAATSIPSAKAYYFDNVPTPANTNENSQHSREIPLLRKTQWDYQTQGYQRVLQQGDDPSSTLSPASAAKPALCKLVATPGTCPVDKPFPFCQPYRSLDSCRSDECFSTLVKRRREFYQGRREIVTEGENNTFWFPYIEDKAAGSILTKREGYPSPTIFCCLTSALDLARCLDENNLSDTSVPLAIKASTLHSDVGVFVFPDGISTAQDALPSPELLTGTSMTLSQVIVALNDLRSPGRLKILVEDFISGAMPGMPPELPIEYKFHMFGGMVGAIDVIANRGYGAGTDDGCGCYAVVDSNWNRLDLNGCFEPSGESDPAPPMEGQCAKLDTAIGAKRAGPVKRNLPLCDEVDLVKPDDCTMADMMMIAMNLSKRVGVYIRIDMFVMPEDGTVRVNEYSANHMNGIRHCASRVNDRSGCIDSCFMGRMWRSVPGNQLFGGEGSPLPFVDESDPMLKDWFDLTSAEQCTRVMDSQRATPTNPVFRSSCLPPLPPKVPSEAPTELTAVVERDPNTDLDPILSPPELSPVASPVNSSDGIFNPEPLLGQPIEGRLAITKCTFFVDGVQDCSRVGVNRVCSFFLNEVSMNPATGLFAPEVLYNSAINPFANMFNVHIYYGVDFGVAILWGTLDDIPVAAFDVGTTNSTYPFNALRLPSAMLTDFITLREEGVLAFAIRLQCNPSIQFISFGGRLTAVDGIAEGLTSVVVTAGFTDEYTPFGGLSYQLSFSGCAHNVFGWISSQETFVSLNRPDFINDGQIIDCPCVFPEQIVFISEFLYGSDYQDFVEIAFTSSLEDYSLEFYDGADGRLYLTLDLTTIRPEGSSGGLTYGVIENLSLVNPEKGVGAGMALLFQNRVVQFLSYEGSFVAVDGTAGGFESFDIGIEEPVTTDQFSFSVAGGSGCFGRDFREWNVGNVTLGQVNANQNVTCAWANLLICNEEGERRLRLQEQQARDRAHRQRRRRERLRR